MDKSHEYVRTICLYVNQHYAGAGKSSLINSLRMGRHRPPGSGSGSGSKPGPVIPGHQRSVSLAPSAVQAVLSRSGMEATDKLLAVGSKQKDKEVESPNNQDSEIQNNEAINNSQADVPHAGVPHAGTSDSGDSEGFLVVGEMSRMGRGMHTTTTAKLIRLPGEGLLADTPGGCYPQWVGKWQLGINIVLLRHSLEILNQGTRVICTNLFITFEPYSAVPHSCLYRLQPT